jgi:hypothetical protein
MKKCPADEPPGKSWEETLKGDAVAALGRDRAKYAWQGSDAP